MTQMWYSKAILQRDFPGRALPDNAMTEQQNHLPQLYQQLDGLMLRDKTRFARRLHGVKKVKNPESQQAILQEMALEISQAAGKVLLREAARPAITYPENLPVSQKNKRFSRRCATTRW